MTDARQQGSPVKVKAFLVDPADMRVRWLNESAEEGLLHASDESLTVEQSVPMAEPLGLVDVIRRVAESGEPEHARTDVISTHRGSMGVGTSVYRLPDGMILVLAEHAWQSTGRNSENAARPTRRGR